MTLNIHDTSHTHLTPKFIDAWHLDEAFFLCCRFCMLQGYEYVIDEGSFKGTRRKEFDFITLAIRHPGTRPLAPTVPEGVPAPATDDVINDYLTYLMTPEKKKNELYTYGEDLSCQIERAILMYKTNGSETNQVCMSVGNRESIFLEHSQCLRLVDTRVRYGALHFIVYFRSWDLWAGFPVNLGGLQLLKEYMASMIGIADGELIAVSKGLHLYEHCWPLAKALCRL